MAVSRVKTSSILQGFPKSRSMLAGNAAYDPAATWLIQRTTLASNTATVTFSSIPSTYKSIQIRYLARNTAGGVFSDMNISPNGSGSVTNHKILADGSIVTATGTTANSQIFLTDSLTASGAAANIFSVGIIDVIDYASTTKNKTFRIFAGQDQNSSFGTLILASSLATGVGTTALSSLVFSCSGNFLAGSTFALYGMVG